MEGDEGTVTVKVETVDITPALAAEWLAQNGHNRHQRETVWRRYARDMASGRWVFNGESIKRCKEGHTDDGQHRLRAIVESGVTITSVVVSGLPHSAQETVDRGMPRNIADALRLRGESSANVLAGAISQAIVLQSPSPGRESDFWPSTGEAIRYLDEHPEIRASVTAATNTSDVLRAPQTTLAALHHLFAAIDEEDATGFFDGLASGAGLDEGSPILALREAMLREWVAPRRMARNRLQAIWIKAWNAYRRGDAVRLLKWKTGGARPEAFPKPE
jgi:hypothetical protein